MSYLAVGVGNICAMRDGRVFFLVLEGAGLGAHSFLDMFDMLRY